MMSSMHLYLENDGKATKDNFPFLFSWYQVVYIIMAHKSVASEM